MDEFVADSITRLVNAMEELACTNRAHLRITHDLAVRAIEREEVIEAQAAELREATLRRAKETHEQHELWAAAVGARAPDYPPEPPLNRAARRRQGRQK